MSQVQDNHLNPTIQGYRHWGGGWGVGWGFGGFGAIINLESQLVGGWGGGGGGGGVGLWGLRGHH